MCTLIKFEFMKLYKKKMNLIVFWGTCVLMAVFMLMSIQQTWIYDEEGNKASGLDYAAYKKETLDALAGPLTDERVEQLVGEYQEIASAPGNSEGEGNDWHLVDSLYYEYYTPRSDLFLLIGHNYDEPGIQTWGANLRELNLEAEDGFYETRQKKLRNTLLAGSSDWQYTKAEQEYWLKKSEKIETPITYGYAEGWARILDIMGFFCIPLVSLFIMTATTYAGEYESNADHIILTTKYGKSKVVAAKNLAALLFGALFHTINIAVSFLIILLSYGIEGWNLPVQNFDLEIPYPFTYLETVLVCAGILYVVALGMTALTLFVSARMKNGLPVLAIMLFIFFIALFLKSSQTNGIYNHILYLLPFNAMDHGTRTLLSYPFGKVVFDYIGMRYVVYLLMLVVLMPFAGRAFKRHQVQ